MQICKIVHKAKHYHPIKNYTTHSFTIAQQTSPIEKQPILNHQEEQGNNQNMDHNHINAQ